MVAVEEIDCGGTGFSGVTDVAFVSVRLIGSRRDLAERYPEIQLCTNKLIPGSVLFLVEQPRMCASLFHALSHLRSVWNCRQHRESGKHLIRDGLTPEPKELFEKASSVLGSAEAWGATYSAPGRGLVLRPDSKRMLFKKRIARKGIALCIP